MPKLAFIIPEQSNSGVHERIITKEPLHPVDSTASQGLEQSIMP